MALRTRVSAVSPDQRNTPFTCDAELVQIGSETVAITVDTLGDEVRRGVVRDLYTVGWLAAVASLSDLAASGARPSGLLLSVSLPPDVDSSRLDAGFADCLEAHGTYLLGGDLQFDEQLSVTTVGVGAVQRALMRVGSQPGDPLYAVGAFGLGNLVALTQNGDEGSPHEGRYLPQIPFEAWMSVVPLVRACTDSSDGLLGALMNLADGVRFDVDLSAVPFDEEVRAIAGRTGLPLAGFAAGVVGDYGLVFTVSHTDVVAFEAASRASGLMAHRIGRCVEAPAHLLRGEGEAHCLSDVQARKLLSCESASELLTVLEGCSISA